MPSKLVDYLASPDYDPGLRPAEQFVAAKAHNVGTVQRSTSR